MDQHTFWVNTPATAKACQANMQTVTWSSGMRKPIDMQRTPCARGGTSCPSALCKHSNSVGGLGLSHS
jgi:hypothetical protein